MTQSHWASCGQVVVKVAGSDAGGVCGIEECGGFGFGECFKGGEGEAIAGAVAVGDHVQQEDGDAGVGQKCGNARTHGSGAEDSGAANKHGLGAEVEDGSRCGGNSAHCGLRGAGAP